MEKNKMCEQALTGLVVNEKVNVNHKLIHNVSAMNHDLKKMELIQP